MPVTGFLTDLLSDYQAQLQRHRNRPFMQATMAACALVSVADGEVSLSERIRVDQILEALESLKVFDPHEAVDQFNEYARDILAHPGIGREKAISAVKVVADDPDKAALLMRIFLAICEAGGRESLAKRIEVVMLCGVLGIDAKGHGLYVDDIPDQDTPQDQGS